MAPAGGLKWLSWRSTVVSGGGPFASEASEGLSKSLSGFFEEGVFFVCFALPLGKGLVGGRFDPTSRVVEEFAGLSARGERAQVGGEVGGRVPRSLRERGEL